MKAITKEWLERAKDDLDTIKKILDDVHLTNVSAFHAQQAVEKAFKAVGSEGIPIFKGNVIILYFSGHAGMKSSICARLTGDNYWYGYSGGTI